jgi:hypothetical protein
VWIAVGSIGLVLVGALAWLGCQVLTVRNEVARAQDAVIALRTGGDIEDNLHVLAESGAAASAAAASPIWGWAEGIPVAGDNLRAVRVAAHALEELSGGIALPVFDGMKSTTGSLASVLPPLQAAGPKLDALSAELAALPKENLIPEVGDGLTQLSSAIELVSPAVKVLPGVLGGDGAKNYLVVAQNNAELMPLGGSASSQTLIRVDGGKLKIVRQAVSQQYDYVTPLDVDLPEGVLRLYGPTMKRHPNATVSRPDWPTAAGLLIGLWNRDIAKDRIDGVISLDPIALSYILKATGPLTLADGTTLTSDNIVKVALRDTYAKYDNYATRVESDIHANAFFKEIAAGVFAKVATGQFDPKAMVLAVQEGVRNRSLMFWSADAEVERLVTSMDAGGVLPQTNSTSTSIGVFLRDHSAGGTKIDYYVDPSASVSTACGADGSTTYTVTVDVHLDITKEAEAKLPDYVRTRRPGQRYDTQVFVYGPLGGTIVSHDAVKNSVYHRKVKDLDRWVTKLTIVTHAGQTGRVTVTYTVPASAGELGPTEVLATPTVRPMKISLDGQACQLPR